PSASCGGSATAVPDSAEAVQEAMTATVVRPPSTSITLPCTNAASSLAKYTAAWAMASGVPLAPAGVPTIMTSAAGCRPGSVPSGLVVRMTPGEMALTRTPDGPDAA